MHVDGSSARPVLPEDTVVIERSGRFLFLLPSRPDWVVTNRNGALVLARCNGQRTIADIRDAVRGAHDRPDEVAAFLAALVARGFFDPPRHDAVRRASPGLRSVHLNVSARCNLACRYCYAEARAGGGEPLGEAEYRRLIDQLDAFGHPVEVAVTGGEPLLNGSACAIGRYAREKGHYTHLLTNGTPVTRRNIGDVMAAFDAVRVSVDGADPATHDAHRGHGTHARTMRSLDLLDRAGARVTIAMTVTLRNIGEVERMAARHGGRLLFQPLFRAGAARGAPELAITGSQYYGALKRAKGVEPMADIGRRLRDLRHCGTVKCAVGDVEVSVAHDGDVFPCHLLHVPEWRAGNVREASLLEIYRSSQRLREARALTVDTRPQCARCPVRLLCGGSCRARAYYATGDVNAADDFCEYERSALIDGLFHAAAQAQTPGPGERARSGNAAIPGTWR